jgi:hypothetical protein
MTPAALPAELAVLNLGIATFLPGLTDANTRTVAAAWSPPARGNAAVGWAAARLAADPRVDSANAEALARLTSSRPVLIGTAPASTLIPTLADRVLLHAGPPLSWNRAAGPVRGAFIGAVLLEGWAETPLAAEAALASGEVHFEPCHHHGAVAPMAGVISPSMPLWIVEDPVTGRRAFSNYNEGLGKVLRFGAYSSEVLERLRWMGSGLFGAIQAALADLGGIELRPLMARALQMGDELHNRNAAATGLLTRLLAPALARIGGGEAARVLEFIGANDHFFLNLSMAACKLAADAGRGVEGSTLCTAMARNGTDFGIQISGLDGQWFTSPAPVVDGLFFGGYGPRDAAPDLGDSAITETAGLGGLSLAAAPAIVQFVGGTSALALDTTRRMAAICLGSHPEYTIPALDFRGVPAGIDARKVVDLNRAPVINTGIAHREAGVGQIGAGITAAPLGCFEGAVAALATDRYGAAL